MGSSSGPTSVKVTTAAVPAGDGQGGGRVGAGLVVSALGLTIGSGRELLRDVNFAAAPGTLTAIIGPSGAGKSILARLVSGMTRPSSGTVTFAGHDVHADGCTESWGTRSATAREREVGSGSQAAAKGLSGIGSAVNAVVLAAEKPRSAR
jgi:ABC-type cobalamin/Fe3+-siderophores transport system ATPase subunit